MDDWLEMPDDDEIDVSGIMRQIRMRIAEREGGATDDVAGAARELWDEMIAPSAAAMELVPITPDECDIYPHDYVINWQNPVLGPINSVVRRVINLEIRRYLDPVLRKQSLLNQRFLDEMLQLARENRRLRYELEAMKESAE
jgi:hypothetical protein